MSHTAAKRTLGICRQASRSTCPCAPAPSRATRTSLEEGLAAEMGVAPNTRPAASEEPMRKSRRSSGFPSCLGSMGLRSVYLDFGDCFTAEAPRRGETRRGAAAGEKLGSFRFASKGTSFWVPLGWPAQLGSFGISRLGGEGGLDSGVAMANCAFSPLRLWRELQGVCKKKKAYSKTPATIVASYYRDRRNAG